MEPKQISYESFIAENLESFNRYRIDELHGKRVRACFHGWVILSDLSDNNNWFLWNPPTSKFICLPPLTHKEKADFNDWCLSAPPGDDRGSVFFFTISLIPTIVFCHLDREAKGLEWNEISYADQLTSIGCRDECLVELLTCCNGKVYVMSMHIGLYRIVIQVDIVVEGEEVALSLLPFVKLPDTTYIPCPLTNRSYTTYTFLKGSSTELFYINVYYWHKSRVGYFNLFKLDMASMMWEEVEDLKDGVLVVNLGLASCNGNINLVFYKSKVSSDIGGYMHCLSSMDTMVSSFHVKDKTMSLSLTPFLLESQLFVWTILECGLEANHLKSKQEEENKDNELVPVKDDEIEFDIATSESHLLNIPFHMLEKIMQLCVGVEYMKFRAACKRCSLAAPSIKWSSNSVTLRRLQLYSLASPWFMLLDNCRGIITFIDPLFGDRYFTRTPQELKGDYQIYCSRFGWLLMYKKKGPLVFYNPFTSDIHELSLPGVYQLESFCFSAPPTSSDCMVVGFSPLEWRVYIHLVSRGSLWTPYHLIFGSDGPHSFCFPTFSSRDVYALCNNERVEALRCNDEDFSLELVVDKAPRSSCRSPAQYFLSSCSQHLLLVIVGEFGESVEVFKLNDSTKEWEKIDNLGKHMVYISSTSCICLEAKSPEMENKIYFPRLLESKKIVFYSLETCGFHTLNDKIIQESFGADLFRVAYQCLPHTWIEPSWS